MSKKFFGQTDIVGWILGAADREGVYEMPDGVLMPRVEGDIVLGPASDSALHLIKCYVAIEQGYRAAHATVMDDEVAHKAFHEETTSILPIVLQTCEKMIAAELACNVAALDVADTKSIVAMAIGEGSVLVGYDDRDVFNRAMLLKAYRDRQAST